MEPYLVLLSRVFSILIMYKWKMYKNNIQMVY